MPDTTETPAANAMLKTIAAKIAEALKQADRAETSVIVGTLALEGQLSDFDNRIAESLKAQAWDGLYETQAALHFAMHLIPESDWPEGFELDAGALPLDVEATQHEGESS